MAEESRGCELAIPAERVGTATLEDHYTDHAKLTSFGFKCEQLANR